MTRDESTRQHRLLADVAVTSIPANKVALADRRYRISSGAPDAALVRSIKTAGLLVPVIVAEIGNGQLAVVAGFRRIEALVVLGIERCEVRVLGARWSELDRLVAGALDGQRDGALSPFDVSRAIGRGLALGLPREVLIRVLLPALGSEPHRTVLKRHRKLASLPPELVSFLETRGSNLRRALKFEQVNAAQAVLLVGLATRHRLSLRALEEWAQQIDEIARRDGCDWTDVIERAELDGKTPDAQGSVGKPAGRRLWELRYPNWARMGRAAQAAARKLDLPDQIQLAWDARFEQDGLALTLNVTAIDELESDLRRLCDEPNRTRLTALLELL